MVGKAKAPNAEQKRRMNTLKENCPCLPCLLTSRQNRLPTIQHVVEGMRRLGHEYTYSSCGWHHLGMTDGYSNQEMMGMFGPSLAHGKRTFQEHFGGERLLVKVQDAIIKEFTKHQWMDYNVPHTVRRMAIHLWTDEKFCPH